VEAPRYYRELDRSRFHPKIGKSWIPYRIMPGSNAHTESVDENRLWTPGQARRGTWAGWGAESGARPYVEIQARLCLRIPPSTKAEREAAWLGAGAEMREGVLYGTSSAFRLRRQRQAASQPADCRRDSQTQPRTRIGREVIRIPSWRSA